MNNNLQLVLKSSTTEMSLNDHDAGIYIVPELDGLTGLPEIRTTSGVNAGYDGGWTSAQNYDARSITIRGVIANEDVATVEQLRRQLTTLAGQGKNEELTLDLVTQAGKAYTIQVRTIALEMSLQKVLTQQEFMLQLRADDPLIYDASETGHEALLQVAQATGGFTIDFELPLAITGSSEETVVNNEGLEQVPTITRMYGALHNPKIINQTTNQFMQIEADLGFAEGDWIEPSEVVSGKDITINGAPEGAPLSSVQIDGETSQNGTPTPDAPQPVKVVTGKNTVKINGKNMMNFGGADISGTLNGITYRYDAATQVWTFDGTASAQTDISYPTNNETNMRWKAGIRYTATGFYLGGTINGSVKLFQQDPNHGWNGVSLDMTSAADKTASHTPSVDYDLMAAHIIRISSGTVLSNFTVRYQVEASSSATEWEAYQAQSYIVDLVYDLLGSSPKTNGYRLGGDGQPYADAPYTLSDYITISSSTSFTYTRNTAGAPSAAICYYDSSKNFISRTVFEVSSTNIVCTPPSGAAYVRITDFTAIIDAVKFYSDTIKLANMAAAQDNFYKSGDKWYLHEEIGKVDLSTLTWSATTDTIRGATAPNAKYVSSNQQIGNAMTDGYRVRKGSGLGNAGAGWFAVDTAKFNFNTGGSTNPTGMLYYELATPTDTEITNEALIEQLEAILQEAKMYNPQTNITTLYAGGNEQATLKVSYFTDKNPDVRDEIIIDSRLRTITLNGLDVYHLKTEGSEFPMLAPGENKLSLQSDIVGDNGYAKVSYKQGYLSI